MACKKRQLEFYRDGDRYVATTGECPQGFKDFLFLTLVGETPESVTETCYQGDQFTKLTQIEGADVPDDWAEAFEKLGVTVPRFEPEPEPEPEPPKQRRRHEPVVSEDEQEFLMHLAAGTDMLTAASVSGRRKHPRRIEPDTRTDVEKMTDNVGMAWAILFFLSGSIGFYWRLMG